MGFPRFQQVIFLSLIFRETILKCHANNDKYNYLAMKDKHLTDIQLYSHQPCINGSKNTVTPRTKSVVLCDFTRTKSSAATAYLLHWMASTAGSPSYPHG